MPFDQIQKKSEALKLLETLLDRQEAKVRAAFMDFVRRVSSDEVIRAIADLVQRGQVTEALAIIGYEGASLGTAANAVFLGSAQTEAEALVDQLRRLAPRAGLAFNPFDSTLAAIARQTGLRFVQETTQSQQNTILDALSRNIGGDVRQTARAIRSAIGLTTAQQDSVRRYRNLLETGSRRAVEVALRDKRFDSSASRAAEGLALDPAKIDRMVERYRQNFVAYRATVIARTEGGHLFGVAREAGFRQMLQQAGIAESRGEKGWRTRRDALVRDLHEPMDGVWVGLNQVFTMPNGEVCYRPKDPSLSAKNRCSCRCLHQFSIRSDSGM